jgi:hypothetical protein
MVLYFLLLCWYSHKNLIVLALLFVLAELFVLLSLEFGEKQGIELCDNLGKMLAVELDSPVVRTKVRRLVADYVNKRDIAVEPERLLKKLEWSVKVRITR